MNKVYILITLVVSALNLKAQSKSFELSNPDAIELTDRNFELLKSGYWRIQRIDMKIRENHIIDYIRENHIDYKSYFGSIEYFDNGTFLYRGNRGTWELIESKFLKHKLDNSEHERRFNFGGIYSATELTDSTLVLTKILTSSYDMSRTIYLRKSVKSQISTLEPFVYRGPMNKKTIDSLSSLSIEELFNYGFNFKNDTILIQTPDSLYRIKRKSN